MINNIQRPHCYNAFYSAKTLPDNVVTKKTNNSALLLKAGTYLTSLACAYLVTSSIARNQSKILNKKINIFNVNYSETDMLKIAGSALVGGTLSGIVIDDKKYVKPKLHECLHQAVANIACPLLFVFLLNRGYEKIQKHVKIFSFKETSALKKTLNTTLKVLPSLLVTAAGLIAGVFAGTCISNFINKQTNKSFKERKVKPLDFCYHPDDVATAFVLADRNGSIQRIVGKIIPPVFALHGFEAGSKRSNE